MHAFCLCNQFLPEIRMGNADQRFRPLPGGQSFEVYHTVFCHHIHRIRTCVGDDGTLRKSGTDTGLQLALLIFEGGGQTDKALASF